MSAFVSQKVVLICSKYFFEKGKKKVEFRKVK